MPSPVYSAGAPGNLINGLSVPHGQTVAAFLDLSTSIEGRLTCEIATGATAPGSGTVFVAYPVYGNATPVTLSAGVSAGATSLSVSSVTGMHPGQRIALQQASGSKLGEIVTVSAVGGTTLTLAAGTSNSYLTGDGIYLMNQTPLPATALPEAAGGGWAANSDYSQPMYLGTGQYIVIASNTDGAQSVTVSVSVDKITAFQ
jgi:hypothetical protein